LETTVPPMDTFRVYLTHAADSLIPGTDPDGVIARRALALAVHAAPSAHDALDVGPMADWDLFTFVIGEAEQMLSADLDPLDLDLDQFPAVGCDTPGLRSAVVNLVRRLANLYTAAATSGRGSPWRRLVWAMIAFRLDDAGRELTRR
jgi:hypothetical protein